MPVHWVRLIWFPRGVVGLSGMAVLAMCLAWPAGAQAQAEDRCLVGNWTYAGEVTNALNGEEMTGTIDLNIPSPTGGTATLAIDIETELHFRHYVGTTEEGYEVFSASTPSAAGGSLTWTSPMPITTSFGIVIPTESASGTYSCTSGELAISVPVPFGGPLTFTRTGPGFAAVDVQVVTQGTGLGTVVSYPAGIDCPGNCSASFWEGTPVQLAAGVTESRFMGWGGPCTPLAPLSYEAGNIPNERECQLGSGGVVTATFGKALIVTTTGAGTVTGATTTPPLPDGFPLPPTIDCPADCWAYFAQQATLIATPADGYEFGAWAGSCSGPVPECQLAMTEESPVTAVFTATHRTLPSLKGSLEKSFERGHYQQTTMRPGTTLWRGENEVLPGRGSHPGAGYFGLEQPTTSAEADDLYNISIWGNNSHCLQAFEVTEAWRAYIGRVADGAGTQVLAPILHAHGRPLTVPQLLHKGWLRKVGPCTPLPPA